MFSCYSYAIGSYSKYPWAPAYCLNGSSAALIAYSSATTVIHRLSSRHCWTFSSASSCCTCPLVLSSKYHSVPPHFRGRDTERQELHVIIACDKCNLIPRWTKRVDEAMIVEKTLIRIPDGWFCLQEAGQLYLQRYSRWLRWLMAQMRAIGKTRIDAGVQFRNDSAVSFLAP